jgi:hypothetical protein
MSEKHILDDKITLKEVVLRFRFWIKYFLGQWKLILGIVLLGGILGAVISIVKKPVYLAETSFVLEESDMGGMGNILHETCRGCSYSY